MLPTQVKEKRVRVKTFCLKLDKTVKAIIRIPLTKYALLPPALHIYPDKRFTKCHKMLKRLRSIPYT